MTQPASTANRIPLDTAPMVWRLTLRTPQGERPVGLVMALIAVEDGSFHGEVRFEGYPSTQTVFPVLGCDWIQAHQMMLQQVRFFLSVFATAGPLCWRGTEIAFEVPARRQRRTLRDRIRSWWSWRRVRDQMTPDAA